ncbi:phosphoribosyltransferase [Streptosporangium sp. NPDC002524]|uniref:phosphoribosyltransferase n=1 Tax=Streptosporangium sp. NPDC002524 TaxID=3154537 RepID=UPI0033210248
MFVLAVIASIVGVLTLWVNLNQYRLQVSRESGLPGERLDPAEAGRILGDVVPDSVRAVAANHIFIESEKKGVGYIDKQEIGVYLDLHTASCDPRKRETLATAMEEFVRKTMGHGYLRGASIASPREGNLLVGAAAAQRLGLNFLMIRTGRAPRFGYPIEGIFSPGSTVILVDDLCMEATFLTRCVRLLRRYGLNVSHCVCLFERLDGNAREGLSGVSVELHSKYQIDDDELARFQRYGESAAGTDERKKGQS